MRVASWVVCFCLLLLLLMWPVACVCSAEDIFGRKPLGVTPDPTCVAARTRPLLSCRRRRFVNPSAVPNLTGKECMVCVCVCVYGVCVYGECVCMGMLSVCVWCVCVCMVCVCVWCVCVCLCVCVWCV